MGSSGLFSLARVAGVGTGGLGLGADASSAQFMQVAGVVNAPDGTVYACDTLANEIRAIPTTGPTLVVAGTGDGRAGYLGDNLPAIAARLDTPMGLARDGHTGALFVADSGNGRIRYFVPGGRIYTYVGGGSNPSDVVAFAGDAMLDQPWGVAMDANGNLYFTERGSGRVRKVDASGRLSTLAVLTPGDVGPIAAATDGSVIWVGEGDHVRVLQPALDPTPIAAAAGSHVTGLCYDQVRTLYLARTTDGASGTAIEALERGDAAPRRIAGLGGPAGPVADYVASTTPLPDARQALLAGAGWCSLYIDLYHLADPIVLAGQLYAGNSYDAGGTTWGQVLRLDPTP